MHRDVKPSNVLLDRQDEAEHCYLADFGLTQSPSERGPTDGQFMGTVAYVSPEQIRGEQVDGRADQYGLACLLFECLTGTVPYGTRSDVAVIFAHLEESVPPASGRAVELPAALDPVLGRGMAKDPADRYESCAALVSAVAEALGVGAAPRPSRIRRALVLGAAMVALLAAGVAAALLAGDDGAKAVPPSGGLVQVDPRTNEVVGRTRIRGHPGQLAVTPGGLWMADFRGGVLWRYEPAADRLERITSNGEPRDLAAFGDKVYVGADGRFLSGIVSRYDAATGIREDGIDLLACAMASGDGVLWAAGCPFAQRLSTDSGRLRKLVEVFLPYQSPATVENSRVQFREMAIGEGSLWVLGDALDRRLWRLDDRTGRVQATVELDFAPVSVEVAGGLVWITDGVRDRVVPVDPDGERILAPVRVGGGPSGVAAGRGALWVVNTIAGTLSRLDPRTRRVVATIDVGGAPRAVAVGGGSVWVTRHAF